MMARPDSALTSRRNGDSQGRQGLAAPPRSPGASSWARAREPACPRDSTEAPLQPPARGKTRAHKEHLSSPWMVPRPAREHLRRPRSGRDPKLLSQAQAHLPLFLRPAGPTGWAGALGSSVALEQTELCGPGREAPGVTSSAQQGSRAGHRAERLPGRRQALPARLVLGSGLGAQCRRESSERSRQQLVTNASRGESTLCSRPHEVPDQEGWGGGQPHTRSLNQKGGHWSWTSQV